MSSAAATMPKKRQADAPEMENTKVEKSLLDKARIVFTWVKSSMADRAHFTLAQYLSSCLRGDRNLLDDYAEYIREESRRLNKEK